ncbi:MAG: hypothetical protein M1133_15160 [Armatimonadetes bacterium]|nr:hypothetical protein [Armatimonadota bacterium]
MPIAQGKWGSAVAIVICDRFSDSSLTYQGYARGIDLATVKMLNDYATSGLTPDLTLLLDLPAEAGLARHTKSDRISSERLVFHQAVRNGFLALAMAESERFVIIDATKPLEQVTREALAVIEKRMAGLEDRPRRGRPPVFSPCR